MSDNVLMVLLTLRWLGNSTSGAHHTEIARERGHPLLCPRTERTGRYAAVAASAPGVHPTLTNPRATWSRRGERVRDGADCVDAQRSVGRSAVVFLAMAAWHRPAMVAHGTQVIGTPPLDSLVGREITRTLSRCQCQLQWNASRTFTSRGCHDNDWGSDAGGGGMGVCG